VLWGIDESEQRSLRADEITGQIGSVAEKFLEFVGSLLVARCQQFRRF
jgi:hypothetical protein